MKVPQTFFIKKKKNFTLDLSLQRKHSQSIAFYIYPTQLSGNIIIQIDFSWPSHSPKYFLVAQRWEMFTRYHGHAGVPKVSLGNANRLASQTLTPWEQISPKPTTSDSLKSVWKKVTVRKGKMFAIFRCTAMIFFPFLLKLLSLQPREINV